MVQPLCGAASLYCAPSLSYFYTEDKMADNMTGRFALIAVFLGITVALLRYFNEIQPEPYMDEIFHIPQAQNYCSYNFSHWNTKITTLPGLYIVSLMLLQLRNVFNIGSLFGEAGAEQICSTLFLRSLNVVFMLGNLWLLYELSYKINANIEVRNEKYVRPAYHDINI